jgi:hypothetical protein
VGARTAAAAASVEAGAGTRSAGWTPNESLREKVAVEAKRGLELVANGGRNSADDEEDGGRDIAAASSRKAL